MRKLIILLLFLPIVSPAQKKQITLEDIYKNGTFRGEQVSGFADENIDRQVDGLDVKDENGKQISLSDYLLSNDGKKILVNDHLLSNDKKRLLVFTNKEQIYRRSSKSIVYLHDILAKKTKKLDNEKIMNATFSPDGSKIAYVKNNKLYLYDVATKSARAITTDGKWNFIINGNCDWVYEEEFGFTRAYQWSPKGNFLAYNRFNKT